MTPGFGAGLVIPDLWQQEAVRALQQRKEWRARGKPRHSRARTHSRNHLNPEIFAAQTDRPEALFIHHKQLMIHESCSLKFELSAIAQIGRRPRPCRVNGRALHFSNRDHLPLMRFRQLAPAGEATTLSDLSEIFANSLLCWRHFNRRR